MANIELTAHGFDQAARKLQGLGDRGKDARPAMRSITQVLLKGEQAYWARSGGAKWPLRADGTKAGVQSGALKASLTQMYAPGAIRVINKDGLVFGTSLWYSRFMQAGTKVKGKQHSPRRPIILIRPVDRKRTREILAAHLKGEL